MDGGFGVVQQQPLPRPVRPSVMFKKGADTVNSVGRRNRERSQGHRGARGPHKGARSKRKQSTAKRVVRSTIQATAVAFCPFGRTVDRKERALHISSTLASSLSLLLFIFGENARWSRGNAKAHATEVTTIPRASQRHPPFFFRLGSLSHSICVRNNVRTNHCAKRCKIDFGRKEPCKRQLRKIRAVAKTRPHMT